MSDTSVLVALRFLGRMALLEIFYGRVLVPPAVADEFLAKAKVTGFGGEYPWLECRGPRDTGRVSELLQVVDRGEAEALALAEEVQADLVLIDEKEGRLLTARLGFALIGVVGILLRARHEGLVECLKLDLDRLRTGLHFHLDDALYRRALELAGEPY